MIFMFFDLNFFLFLLMKNSSVKKKKSFECEKSIFVPFLLSGHGLLFLLFTSIAFFEALWFVPHNNPSFLLWKFFWLKNSLPKKLQLELQLHNWFYNFYFYFHSIPFQNFSLSLSSMFQFSYFNFYFVGIYFNTYYVLMYVCHEIVLLLCAVKCVSLFTHHMK